MFGFFSFVSHSLSKLTVGSAALQRSQKSRSAYLSAPRESAELLTRNAELRLLLVLHLEHFHFLQDKNRALFVFICALIVLLAPISMYT